MKNVMCVDLEDWYNANLAVGIDLDKAESRVVKNVEALLEIFQMTATKCTFFVLGSIAEKYPKLISKIVEEGHEVASHGYAHQLVYSQKPDEFREDIKKAKDILEGITNIPVNSYRAPSWSIREDSFWALEILQEEGFKNDSSIFPFKNFLYGVSHAPRFVYSTEKYNKKSHLNEFPPSTIKVLGITVPYAGGFYFRALPLWFIKRCIKINNKKGHASIMYIHPWEIDANTPRIKLGLRDSLIQYWGISGCKKKLIKLLNTFEFTNMSTVMEKG